MPPPVPRPTSPLPPHASGWPRSTEKSPRDRLPLRWRFPAVAERLVGLEPSCRSPGRVQSGSLRSPPLRHAASYGSPPEDTPELGRIAQIGCATPVTNEERRSRRDPWRSRTPARRTSPRKGWIGPASPARRVAWATPPGGRLRPGSMGTAGSATGTDGPRRLELSGRQRKEGFTSSAPVCDSRLNQERSTSAMWRTSPWSERFELATGRSLRAWSSSPSAFSSSVARWNSSQASSIPRSDRPSIRGSVRRGSTRSRTISVNLARRPAGDVPQRCR